MSVSVCLCLCVFVSVYLCLCLCLCLYVCVFQCRDAADDHLSTELVHLDNLKKMLESHLALVKIQLQTLFEARERLTAVFNERARVIDLLCYAVPCVGQ